MKQQGLFITVSGGVIFTSKNVTLRNNPFNYPFYKLDSVIERVHRMSPSAIHLTDYQLSSIIKNIHSSHHPFKLQTSLLEHYGINTSEIIEGIVCPSCRSKTLRKERYSWFCDYCNCKTRSGLQQAVEEYLTIVKPTLTNLEFRVYFGI